MRILVFTFLTALLQGSVFYGLLGGELPVITNPEDTYKIPLIMYTPFFGAILTQLIFREKIPFKDVFGTLNRYHLLAILIPVGIYLLTTLFSLLNSNVELNLEFTGLLERSLDVNQVKVYTENFNRWKILLNYLMPAIFTTTSMALFTAFGEEYGWRGYLLRQFKSPLRANLYIGVVWGLWHSPMVLKGYNYPSNPLLGVGMMVVLCLALTPIMNDITRKSKSILTGALFHASINSFVALPLVFLRGEETSFFMAFGSWPMIGAILFISGLYFLLKKHLLKKSKVGLID